MQKKVTVQWLTDKLRTAAILVEAVEGNMDVHSRLLNIKRFRDGNISVLVTTNLLARGLDFPDVCLVLNFDIPTNEKSGVDTKSYLHRIGRTGRFGKYLNNTIYLY